MLDPRLQALERKIRDVEIRSGAIARTLGGLDAGIRDLWKMPFAANPPGPTPEPDDAVDLGGPYKIVYRLMKACDYPPAAFPGVPVRVDYEHDHGEGTLDVTTNAQGELTFSTPETIEIRLTPDPEDTIVGWRERGSAILRRRVDSPDPLVFEVFDIIPDDQDAYFCIRDIHTPADDGFFAISRGVPLFYLDLPGGIRVSRNTPTFGCVPYNGHALNFVRDTEPKAVCRTEIVGGQVVSAAPSPGPALYDFTNTTSRGHAYHTYKPDDMVFTVHGTTRDAVIRAEIDGTYGMVTGYTILDAGSGITPPAGQSYIDTELNPSLFPANDADGALIAFLHGGVPLLVVDVHLNRGDCAFFTPIRGYLRGHVTSIDPVEIAYSVLHEEEGGPVGGGDIRGRRISQYFSGDTIYVREV